MLLFRNFFLLCRKRNRLCSYLESITREVYFGSYETLSCTVASYRWMDAVVPALGKYLLSIRAYNGTCFYFERMVCGVLYGHLLYGYLFFCASTSLQAAICCSIGRVYLISYCIWQLVCLC